MVCSRAALTVAGCLRPCPWSSRTSPAVCARALLPQRPATESTARGSRVAWAAEIIKSYKMNLPPTFLEMVTRDARTLRHKAEGGNYVDDKGTTWWQVRRPRFPLSHAGEQSGGHVYALMVMTRSRLYHRGIAKYSATAPCHKLLPGAQPKSEPRRFSVEQMIEIIAKMDFPDGMPKTIVGAVRPLPSHPYLNTARGTGY